MTNFTRPKQLTIKILSAMILGLILGTLLNQLSPDYPAKIFMVDGVFDALGKIFITLLRMLVVPIVFVSLVCGVCHLNDSRKLGRMAFKTIFLYLITTAIAITLAMLFAKLFNIGTGIALPKAESFKIPAAPSIKETILNLFPTNPIKAMAEGNMIQIIVFAILFGVALGLVGDKAKKVTELFHQTNEVLMKLILLIMKIAPYGIFCLITVLFAKVGLDLVKQLLGYFVTVLFVLAFQWSVVYGGMLVLLARVNPLTFFKKMFDAMLFAFSTSSSNASIPIVLDTAERKLGVDNSVASFVIPLGATVNMDGTAIMQGVATVFIASLYHVHLGLGGYITVILTATLASVGTAGVPGVGMITLAMVLQQVGLPVQAIALILGVDRLLDMTRTAVNISGDCAVACVVAQSENEWDQKRFNH